MARKAARAFDDKAEEFLAVDHLQHDLVGRSIRSGGITLAAQGVKVVIQAMAIVVLARLLAPSDFGLYAMVAAFLTLLEIFKDMGLSTATVQRPDLTHRQVSTLFWLNSALGLSVTVILALCAPLFVWIYNEPLLLWITPTVAIAFIFTGISSQHLALLRRQMRFTAASLTQVGAEIIALFAAVAAAMLHFGVWSLVIQRLVWAVAIALGAFLTCRWRPGKWGPFAEVRALVHFGGNSTGSMAINFLVSNLDKVLIGAYWGAAPLGLYERAQRLQMLAIQNLNTPLANVALSTLSRLGDDPKRYRDVYFNAVERLAMVIAPLGGLLVAAAGPIVALVLGPQWAEAAPIVAWMSLAMAYLPVSYAVSWLYMSQDRTPEMLRASWWNSAVVLASMAAGLPFGPLGVAASYVATGLVIRIPLVFWLVGRRGPVSARDLWSAILMPAAAGAIVAAVVWAAQQWPALTRLPLLMEVTVLTTLAMVTTLLVYLAVPRGRHALHGILRLPAVFFAKTAPAPR